MTSSDIERLAKRQAAVRPVVAMPHRVGQRARVGRAPDPAGTRMLSLADVAERLHVSIKTVRRWIDAGELHVHQFGRQLRVSLDDLNSFISQRRK